jgi:hypothetical protein
MSQYHSSERGEGTERKRKVKRKINTVLKLSSVAEFEVVIAMTMKNAIFWDVVPCRLAVHQCFGETYCLHLQDKGVSQTSSQQDQDSKQYPSTRLHYVTSQKTVLFLLCVVTCHLNSWRVWGIDWLLTLLLVNILKSIWKTEYTRIHNNLNKCALNSMLYHLHSSRYWQVIWDFLGE